MGMRFSGCIQVGNVFKATKYTQLGSGRVTCKIYGQVQNHWGVIARPGAMYFVDDVGADSVDELRAAARKRIDELKSSGQILLGCRSRKEYARCYQVPA